MKKLLFILASLALTGGVVFSQTTTTNFFDTFESGQTGGAPITNTYSVGPVSWYQFTQQGPVGIVSDSFAGGGSTNALQVTAGGINTFKGIAGTFNNVALGSGIGDALTLSFAFHYLDGPQTNAAGLRFGLYNPGSDQLTSNYVNSGNAPATTNDFGYNVRLGTGNSLSTDLWKEPAGDNPLGGGTAGTSLTNAANPGTMVSTNIFNTSAHTFALTISLESTTNLLLNLQLDGTTVATARDFGSLAPSGLITNFGQFYIANGSINNSFVIDNALLTSTVIPEPSTVLLVGVGLLGAWIVRRRR